MTAAERTLRTLLVLAGNTVHPSPDALQRIRARVAARRPWWRRAWDRLTAHTHDWTGGDWIDTEIVRCRICGQHPEESKAAGVAQTPAAQAVDRKDDTAMSHDLIEETTPRGRQIAAALALAHLLEANPLADAPGGLVPNWRVDAAGRLHGHVHDPCSDANARAALHTFAGFLGLEGAKRSQGRNSHSEWVHLSVTAEYRGVQVNVWTHVDIRPVSPYASFEGRTA